MRGLKICLWLAGIGCLLSVFGMFMPMSMWRSVAEFFGIEQLPDTPLFEYVIRVMSATYVGIGVFYVLLARKPLSYGEMVPFSGIAAVLLGVVCLMTGSLLEFPPLWYLGDTISCIVIGFLILIFWQKAKEALDTKQNDT